MGKIREYKEKWLKITRDTSDTDLKIVKALIPRVYSIRKNSLPQHVLLVDSPLACLHASTLFGERRRKILLKRGEWSPWEKKETIFREQLQNRNEFMYIWSKAYTFLYCMYATRENRPHYFIINTSLYEALVPLPRRYR